MIVRTSPDGAAGGPYNQTHTSPEFRALGCRFVKCVCEVTATGAGVLN